MRIDQSPVDSVVHRSLSRERAGPVTALFPAIIER
jgi:hypothetical protein